MDNFGFTMTHFKVSVRSAKSQRKSYHFLHHIHPNKSDPYDVSPKWGGPDKTAHTCSHMGGISQDVKRLKMWEFYPLFFGFS